MDINLKFDSIGNGKRIILKNNDEELYIEPKCLFETDGVQDGVDFLGNINKYITLSINYEKEEHFMFLNLIRKIINDIKDYLIENNILLEIVDPLIKNNYDNNYKINLIIKNFTDKNTKVFYDNENNTLKIKNIKNIKIKIYPLIHISSITINLDKVYINIFLNEAFIYIKEDIRRLNYNEYKEYIKKINKLI